MPRSLNSRWRVTLAWLNAIALAGCAALPAFSQQPQQPQNPGQGNSGQTGSGQGGPGQGGGKQDQGAGSRGNPQKPGDFRKGDRQGNHNGNGQNPPASPDQDQNSEEVTGPKTPLLRKETVIDFRSLNDPASQRARRTTDITLPLYGYNFFEPARQAITAYRYRFQQLLGPSYPGAYNNGPNGNGFNGNNGNNGANGNNPNNPNNGDNGNFNNGPGGNPNFGPGGNGPGGYGGSRGAGSGTDILGNSRANGGNGNGGDTSQGYRGQGYSPSDSSGRSGAGDQRRSGSRIPTRDQVDALSHLSQSQLDDLRQRAAQGKLTDDERQRYGSLLDSNTLVVSSVLNAKDDDLSSTLTDSQKLDLLIRKRDDLLTEDEKRRYARFLYGTKGMGQSDQDQTNQSFGQSTNPAFGQPQQQQQQQQDQSIPQAFRGQDFSFPNPPAKNAFQQIAGPLDLIYQNITASVPANYQLAAGDRVIYRYSSPTTEMRELTVEVDPTGGLAVPDIGRVMVQGKTLAQAETDFQNRLQRFYRNAQVSLSLKELRTIQVTVTGKSFAPGTYVVPAVATAFNMLYATGGPTDDGSLRQIEVRRKGKTAGVIDFYKFLLTGDKTAADIQLETGDVIYIPACVSRVTVSGEVREAAIYEVARDESLRDTLTFAGGVKATGVTQRVQVTTVQPGAARLTKDVDVSQIQTASKVPVYDGDVVEVFSVRDELTNVVTIDGAVDIPGQYAVSPGMKVADLVGRARGLLVDAYPTLAHLYRWNPDNTLTLVPINLEKAMAGDVKENVTIQRWDRLTVYGRQEIAWTGRRDVTVRGAVKNAGIYYRSDNMRVRDLLMLAGGTNPVAYMERAYLLHQHPDGTFAYDIVDLNKALRDDAQNNALIEDHDILAVYKSDEAKFTPEHIVTIHGEVNAPGKYPRGDQMKLSDVLGVAGGLTARAGSTIMIAHARRPEGEAAIKATFDPSTAKTTPDPVLEDGDVVTIQGRGDLRDQAAVVNVSGAVNFPGPVALSGPKVRMSEVIKLAGGLKPEAFPEGVEFTRNPDSLATAHQRQLMDVLNRLNDILNQADYKRALAASDVEKYRAISDAGKGGSAVSIPGFTAPSVSVPDAGLTETTKQLSTRELVSQPRTLTLDDLAPKGSVAVNLAAAMTHPGSDDDILMLDGDSITVPNRPTTVQVVGAVMDSRGVLYREGEKLDYYLEHAGGFARDAAKDRILVIRLGGGLLPVEKVKKFLPGDVIMVPTKPIAESIQKRGNQFDSMFRSLTNSALIILVAKKLLGL